MFGTFEMLLMLLYTPRQFQGILGTKQSIWQAVSVRDAGCPLELSQLAQSTQTLPIQTFKSKSKV